MPLDNAKALFNSLGFTVQPQPSTEEEIAALEKQLGVTLPGVYREFLLWMGKSRAGILLGSKWLIEDVPGLKASLISALATYNAALKLPDDAFPFWDSQDYEYAFLRLSQGDASLVYRFHGTLDLTVSSFPIASVNFEQWLIEKMQQHVERMKSLGQPY